MSAVMSKDGFELVTGFHQETAGQSLVETALLGSLLMALLLGIVELGRVTYAAIEVSNAAKAAVAYATQNGHTAADTTGIATAAASEAANLTGLTTTSSASCVCSDGTTPPSGSCTTSGICSSSQVIETVTVNTQATFNPLIHLPGLPTTYTLKGKAVQECLQ
jgi:Flp pilus assembly protein TadG